MPRVAEDALVDGARGSIYGWEFGLLMGSSRLRVRTTFGIASMPSISLDLSVFKRVALLAIAYGLGPALLASAWAQGAD